jgi:hypothetical protein
MQVESMMSAATAKAPVSGRPSGGRGSPAASAFAAATHSTDLRHDIGIVQGVQVPGRLEAGDRDSWLPMLEGEASVASHRGVLARANIQREARRGLATRLHAGRERSFEDRRGQ